VLGAALTAAVLMGAFLTLQAGSAIARVLTSSHASDVVPPPPEFGAANASLLRSAPRQSPPGAGPRIVSPIAALELSARFGRRGGHWALRHTGLDFVANWGTAVHSATDGLIIRTARHPALGKVVVIKFRDGVTIWYCHLSSINKRHGRVTAGTTIGRVGSTGNATGPHLHVELRVNDRQVDPQPFLFGNPAGQVGAVPRWLTKQVVPYDSL